MELRQSSSLPAIQRRAIIRNDIKNPSSHTRVTDTWILGVLDSSWINFLGFAASDQEMVNNPARTRMSSWTNVGEFFWS